MWIEILTKYLPYIGGPIIATAIGFYLYLKGRRSENTKIQFANMKTALKVYDQYKSKAKVVDAKKKAIYKDLEKTESINDKAKKYTDLFSNDPLE